ncbi:hypothetical protein J32TS2_35080 [Shouchella clausii]|jgi:hypothetical protein|nr:hypothetical protein J1TS1_10220 [Shouchella clausii]GIN18152.1 hypothetical protein J32TS2_35080 [Shouchella clausii]SHL50553.1 hypothetical protein SAMN05192535_2459 [Shouchella rhizosphaerae]
MKRNRRRIRGCWGETSGQYRVESELAISGTRKEIDGISDFFFFSLTEPNKHDKSNSKRFHLIS